MKKKTKQQLNLTQQIMSDLRSVWKPYTPRVLPKDHIFWQDVNPESAKWYPKNGQADIGKAILSGKYDLVVVELARQTGKSALLNAVPWYKGLMTPASATYYFAPLRKQVKDFVWNKQRAQTMNATAAVNLDGTPNTDVLKTFEQRCKKYIKGKPDNQEMMITWLNNSQFLVDGADNIDARRGVTANMVILDECRDMKPGIYDAMKPSIKVRRGCVVAISSSPYAEGEFTTLVKLAKDPNNPKSIYFKSPSWMNPYMPLEDLEHTRAEYVLRDELDIWQREYCSEMIIGGSRSIFPMVKGNEFVPHRQVMNQVRQLDNLEFYCVADPGSADNGSAFAVLFAAYHPFTRQIFLLDEIYATKEGSKSTGAIEPLIASKIQELAPYLDKDCWNFVYDEAATWFRNEMQDRQYGFNPTMKRSHGKDQGLSTIKDAWVKNHVVMSDNCQMLMWELTQYIRNDKGKIPNKDDHLIDTLRYLLAACHYHITQDDPYEARFPTKGELTKGYTVEDDLRRWGAFNILGNDPTDDWLSY